MPVEFTELSVHSPALLRSLGFEEDRGRDHIFFYFRCASKIIVRTKIPHGATEITQPLLGLIGKQLKLNRRELERLLQGQLSQTEYKSLLRAKGLC